MKFRFVLLLITFAAGVFSGPRVTRAQANENLDELNAQVEKRIKDLALGGDKARGAADWLLNTPPTALPAIEAAAKTYDATTDVGKHLNGVLQRLRPLDKVRAAMDQVRRSDLDWNVRTAISSYNRFGRKNLAWDDVARKGIRQFTSIDPAEHAAAVVTLEHVTNDLKCDDPLILYLDARSLAASHEVAKIGPVAETYIVSCKNFEGSDYPADRKVWAMVRMLDFIAATNVGQAHPETKPFFDKCAATSLELWPKVLAEPGLPMIFARELADLILKAQVREGADRATVAKSMLAPFEKAFPGSAEPLAFEGQAYIDYAWDARGNGFAQTVTPEGWKLMAERLDVAEAILEKACALDPSDPTPAAAGISCELGQGKGIDNMEKWFRRAVTANPQHFHGYPYTGQSDAYDRALYYLQPKWHGSPEAMLAFGRACAETHDWYDGVSSVLMDAHEQIAQLSGNPDEYWHDPNVWADVLKVIGVQTRAEPENARAGTVLAYWAIKCGQWKAADAEFKELGNRSLPEVFGGQAALDAARAEAAEKARTGG